MKIVSKIAEKILSHCSTCGQCPVVRITDAQGETRDNISPKAQLKKENPKFHSLDREHQQS